MIEKVKRLTSHELNQLKKFFSPLTFDNSFILTYEGQVPPIGFVLLKGTIELLKKNKIVMIVPPGFILGVQQLIKNEATEFSYRVVSPSEILVLQKSTILQLLRDRQSEMYSILKQDL